MKRMSTFQIVLSAVFIIGALVGLFVFATYTSKSKSDAIGNVRIWGTLPKKEMEATLVSIAKSDTSFKNVTYIEKDQASFPSELASAIATGNAPDLVLDSQENLLALSKLVEPIPQEILPANSFVSTFIAEGNLFTVPGGYGYYGMPFLVDPLVLFSNRSILSSTGIAAPPATWEALTGLAPSIAVLTSTRQITRALIALGTYDNVRNARGILSTLFLQMGLPMSTYENGVISTDLGQNSENGVPPGRSVLNFYTQFADPSKVSYTWDPSLPDSEKMFLTGNLALYIGYASRARYLASANPNLDFEASAMPQPATATTKSVYGLVYAFMIPRGAGNPSGAYETAALFTQADKQSVAAEMTGLAPAVRSQLISLPSDPLAAVSYAEALYSKGWLSPSPQNTDRVFSSMIGNVISGRSSFDTALNAAEQALGALLHK